MRFDLPAEHYDRFMGRYSRKLAPLFADFAGVSSGMRVLDVGCGTGVLTVELARRVGATATAATDPSEPMLSACRARVPDADVRLGPGEELPWPNASFDAALAQLVVSFMKDAPRAVREMRRVLRPSGTLAACMWADDASMQLLHTFWRAAATSDPQTSNAEVHKYRTPGALLALWREAGASHVEVSALEVEVSYVDFADYWTAMTTAAGPVGAYITKQTPAQLAVLRERCHDELGAPPSSFNLQARAWAVRGAA